MRISSVIRVIENATIAAAARAAEATRNLKDEVDKEYMVRKLYNDEQRAPKQKRLAELRELVTQLDARAAAQEREA